MVAIRETARTGEQAFAACLWVGAAACTLRALSLIETTTTSARHGCLCWLARRRVPTGRAASPPTDGAQWLRSMVRYGVLYQVKDGAAGSGLSEGLGVGRQCNPVRF